MEHVREPLLKVMVRCHDALCVLDHTDLGGPEHSSIQHEAFLLRVEADPVLLVWLWCLEHGFMHIWIELLGGLAGVETFEAVLLERADQDAVGHLDAVVQGDEV